MKRVFIDFDGVILDTQFKVEQIKKDDYPNISWKEFSEIFDWDNFYNNAKIINDSINILRKADKDNTFIITKTDSMMEQEAKYRFLRNSDIDLPIFFVPFSINKSDVIEPMKDDYLIDDNINNVNEWINKGGSGIYFDTAKSLYDIMEAL